VNDGHLSFLSSPEWAEMLEHDLLPWVLSVGDLGDHVVELGPGPGLTTELLRRRVDRVTAVEVDPALAEQLRARLAGSNVTVLQADGADTGLAEQSCSAVACFSMLHHVPTASQQDGLFAESARVLRAGGCFVAVDSRDLEAIRAGHVGDTFTPVPPETLATRLEAAGLRDVRLDVGEYQIRFAAWKP
jgi:SAM-dependent methyltransferase